MRNLSPAFGDAQHRLQAGLRAAAPPQLAPLSLSFGLRDLLVDRLAAIPASRFFRRRGFRPAGGTRVPRRPAAGGRR
jgi:hypothetical protein